jgi:hypothetical protein
MPVEVCERRANKHLSDSIEEGLPDGPEGNYNPKLKQMPFWRRHAKLLALAAVVVCLVLTSRVSAASSSKTPPKELYSCINDGQPDQQLTTYRDFAYQKPAR